MLLLGYYETGMVFARIALILSLSLSTCMRECTDSGKPWEVASTSKADITFPVF